MKRVCFISITLLLAYLAWFIGANIDYLSTSCIDNFDRELLALGTYSAKHGEALTGAYSRLGFRHPGPFLFYYLAAFDSLSPLPFEFNGTSKVAILIFNIAVLFISSFVLIKFIKLPLLGILLFPALLLSLPNDTPYLADYWNPRPVTTVFILAILSLVASFKDRRLLPLVILSSLIAFHLHLGAVFGIIPISVCAVALAYKSTSLQVKTACAIVVAVFMFPVFLNMFQEKGLGNIGEIAIVSSSNGWSHTYDEVYELVGSYFRTVIPFLPRYLAIVSVLSFAVGGAKKLGRDGTNILLLSLLVIPFVAIGAFRVYGPLHQYLLSFAHGVVAIFVALGLSYVVAASAKFLKRDEILIGSILSALVIVLNLSAPITKRECASEINVPKYIDALEPTLTSKYKLNIAEIETRFAPKILLELLQRGISVCVDREVSYLYGEGLICSDSADTVNIWLLPKGAEGPAGANGKYDGTRGVLWW